MLTTTRKSETVTFELEPVQWLKPRDIHLSEACVRAARCMADLHKGLLGEGGIKESFMKGAALPELAEKLEGLIFTSKFTAADFLPESRNVPGFSGVFVKVRSLRSALAEGDRGAVAGAFAGMGVIFLGAGSVISFP